MSRPRRYRPVVATNVAGESGWAIKGECLSPECSEPHERWGLCGHWELLPGWWPEWEMAVAQILVWQRRQQNMLANGWELGTPRSWWEAA